MSKVLLRDAPGGPELINCLRDEAANLALFFLNEPEAKVLAALQQTRRNLEAEITPILGAEMAGQIAEAFVGAVAGHKRELEAGGVMSRVNYLRR